MGILVVLYTLVVIVLKSFQAFLELIVPPRRKSIAGETVLITGGGHGIGRELALEIATLDTTVIVWDVNKTTCEQTVADIKKNGGRAFAYECDITKSSQVKEVASKVRQDVGNVSILINNAGILNGAPLLELDEVDIRRTFEVNILSHFWIIREFLPHMKNKNHGHILNVCSMSSFSGTANLTDYSASKYAALGFSESLTEELILEGYTGIRISSLCPMFVDTGLVKHVKDEDNKVAILLTPREVALTALDGMLRNQEIITVPTYFWLVIKIGTFLPRRVSQFLKRSTPFKIKPQYKKVN